MLRCSVAAGAPTLVLLFTQLLLMFLLFLEHLLRLASPWSNVAGAPALTDFPAAMGFPAVSGIPAIAGVFALAEVPAVDGVPAAWDYLILLASTLMQTSLL